MTIQKSGLTSQRMCVLLGKISVKKKSNLLEKYGNAKN